MVKFKFALTLILLTSCGTPVNPEPLLVATLFPQYSLASSLAGDLMDIKWLVPAGVDPHDYEPTPSQRVELNNADLILFTSETFEVWIHDIEETVQGKLIDLSSYVSLLSTTPVVENQFFANTIDDDHDHDFDGDPHYWVDPANGKLMLDIIAEELITLLPEHELLIQSRQQLIEEALFDAVLLYDELVLEGDELDIVFAGHNALGYLVNYDIQVLTPYPGFSSEVIPTAQSIIDFKTLMSTLETNLLYISSTDNTSVTDTLLEGDPTIETVTLYTLETISQPQLDADMTYQELLLLNYEALAQSEN